jgi:beta-galactosidase GanA
MPTIQKVIIAAMAALLPASIEAQAGPQPIPRIVQKDGRYSLFVDGAPYLMLGGQVLNSSGWPMALPKVWAAVENMHANTVEIPVYWEQLEPQPGVFDFSVVDTLLSQAREHRVRLVLLWFGTWKNGSAHYMPLWMKTGPDRYPRVTGADGRLVDSPSPYARAALDADTLAFVALMRHLKEADQERTVIMVQVENEPGTWGSVRDYSPAAQKLFEDAVPPELLAVTHRDTAGRNTTWQDAFGADAEEFFHAWSVAHYIGQVAAAGKAEYPLPLYVNAALRDPLQPSPPGSYESGGATDNVLAIWKAAAPAIDLLAPDIYLGDSARYFKVLDLYRRPDNALFVPETGVSPEYARYFFAALGHGAIGFSPFGIDDSGYLILALGGPKVTEEPLTQFALNYKVAGPMMRELARLNFEGKLRAVAEEEKTHTQSMDFGPWKAQVSYGVPVWGPGNNPAGNPQPEGRALVAQLDENVFLVTGFFCRVDFQVSDAASGKQREFLRVEEGTYENGVFKPIRIWNGDQTDWGLNFTSSPVALRVMLGTY